MRSTIVLYLLFLCSATMAQAPYNASTIPKELLPYASAVIRNEEITNEVKDLDNVVYHVKRAITVLNKNGDDIAHIAIYYNKNISIRNIKGIIYNEYGKATGKFGEHEFIDQSTGDNSTLFQDYRVKHYLPGITEYPFTIEYEYELKLKQTLNIEGWEPVNEAGLAVEQSSYKFICQPDFNIRFKEFNLPTKAVIISDGKTKTYTWQIANIKAVKNEPFSPYPENMVARVLIAPEKFSYYGVHGTYTNWLDLGKWQYDKLLANRQDVSPGTADYIKEITKNITDPKQKAKKVYEYMQQKTHYISIQVGIGGYQPFPASDVDKLNYGDCKALVNYAQALLKVAGVDSWYCVVYGNHREKRSMISDFASMQGNHIILCLPFKNDTTWAECTSQQIPFGFLGDFTDDRTVLACTPEGGKLMHTPKYTAAENLESRKANFTLDEAGELNGEMSTVFEGADYDDRYQTIEESPAERLKSIKRKYPINNLEITELDYKQDKGLKPITTENIILSAREYAANNNGKLYFSLNSVDRTEPLRAIRNRVNPVYITRGYTEEDEITYTIPKGYRLDTEPLNKSIEKSFGSFTAKMTLKDDHLVYVRKFQLKDGSYDRDTYSDMIDFYQSVADADEYNVTLVKK
jgi:hypothetical protein